MQVEQIQQGQEILKLLSELITLAIERGTPEQKREAHALALKILGPENSH